jgi:endonuclease YncB( thermonuclease family)
MFLPLLFATAVAQSGTPVARIVTGDDLILGTQPYQLFGVDAPDVGQMCLDANSQPYPCGADALRSLGRIASEKPVSCTPVGKQPSGTIRSALCKVGRLDIAEELLRSGWVVATAESPPEYKSAEYEARQSRRGIWAGTFVWPSEWRRRGGGAPLICTRSKGLRSCPTLPETPER